MLLTGVPYADMQYTTAQTSLTQRLTERYGPGEAASIARIVLEDAFHWTSRQQDRLMEPAELARFELIGARLQAGEPVQYILGAADFFGLKFLVTPATLIPRQETEVLVAEILKHLKANASTRPVLLDIGLGSGCIGLTLKKKFPSLKLFGLEKSEAALAVSSENARLILGEKSTDAELLQGDILRLDALPLLPDFDIIVSNPPYIPSSEKHLVPQHVHAHEPWLALFVEADDPLLFYRVIADFSLDKLLPGGALFFECNEFNANEVAVMLGEKGFANIRLQQDLSGADRIVYASIKSFKSH